MQYSSDSDGQVQTRLASACRARIVGSTTGNCESLYLRVSSSSVYSSGYATGEVERRRVKSFSRNPVESNYRAFFSVELLAVWRVSVVVAGLPSSVFATMSVSLSVGR